MFLKNSLLTLFLVTWIFPFSLIENKSTKVEIQIPSLDIQENKKEFKGNVLLLEQDLTDLKINDSIIIKSDENRYFYKIRNISYKEEKENFQNTNSQDTIYLVGNKKENLHSVITAIYTGKLIEN